MYSWVFFSRGSFGCRRRSENKERMAFSLGLGTIKYEASLHACLFLAICEALVSVGFPVAAANRQEDLVAVADLVLLAAVVVAAARALALAGHGLKVSGLGGRSPGYN